MSKIFNTLYLEATRNCNLSCRYCSTGSKSYEKHLDKSYDEIVNRILLPAYNIGTRLLSFSGGEFLLRNDALELLDKANKIGFNLTVASNGILLTEKKIKEIKNVVGDNIVISLGINSFDLDNKKTRNIETENTLRVLEMLEKNSIKANISVTIGEFNKHSIAKTLENIQKLHLPFNRIPFVPRSCPNVELMFNKESLRDFFHPELIKYFGGQGSYTPYMLPPDVYEKSSGQSFDEIQVPTNPNVGCWVGAYYAINPEGEVSPCPMFLDHVSGGNVYETPLEDILFKSELFTKITDRKNLEGKCGNCKYTNTCGGCRVMSYYYTGNVYAEDPTCFLDELSEEQIEKIEKTTIRSFKNYLRMAKFGGLFKGVKS